MTEAKTKKDGDERVAKLESKVNAQGRILDKVLDVCERHFGSDLDGDGVIGKSRAALKAGRTTLPALVAVLLIGAIVASAATIWNIDNASRSGDAKIEHDGTDYTLTVDKISAESVTASSTIEGVPAAGTAGTGVTATETYGTVNETVLVLDDVSVVVTEQGAGTNAVGGTKIYDFTEGRILVLGAIMENATITIDTNAIDAADGGDVACGTAVPGIDGVMDGTAVDIIPSTSVDPITNIVDNALAASAQFDGTTTAKDLYFNILIDDADVSATHTNTVDATITIHWINLGDY